MSAVIADKGESGTVDQSGDYPADGVAEGRVAAPMRRATLKHEDAPLIAARQQILRRFPLSGGIDFSSCMEFSGGMDARIGGSAISNWFRVVAAPSVGHAGFGQLVGARNLPARGAGPNKSF